MLTRPIKEILSIVLVNKQVREEALPVFYKINHFCFEDYKTAATVLRRMPENHRFHITQLTFDLYIKKSAAYKQDLAFITKLPQLQKLGVILDEERWLENQGPRFGVTDVKDMPGVKILSSLRGLREAKFMGGCPKLRGLLKAGMLRPKVVVKAGGGRVKRARKTVEAREDDGMTAGTGKRVKRSKTANA